MRFNNPNGLTREEIVAFFNAEETQRGVLEFARSSSREAGLEISFEGVYRQGFLEDNNLVNLMPFVIAQSREAIVARNRGILEGMVFEFMKYAFISGKIDEKNISFVKQYEPNPFLKVNPNPIEYFGVATADGVYRGKWRFSSDRGDLARNGTFEIIPVS
jgi:hypothetical protein